MVWICALRIAGGKDEEEWDNGQLLELKFMDSNYAPGMQYHDIDPKRSGVDKLRGWEHFQAPVNIRFSASALGTPRQRVAPVLVSPGVHLLCLFLPW